MYFGLRIKVANSLASHMPPEFCKFISIELQKRVVLTAEYSVFFSWDRAGWHCVPHNIQSMDAPVLSGAEGEKHNYPRRGFLAERSVPELQSGRWQGQAERQLG